MTDQGTSGAQPQRLDRLIKSEYDYERPRRGEVHEAVVLAIGEHDLLVDLGAKRDGFVPPQDLDKVDEAYLADIQVGDRVPVLVTRSGGPEGIVVSLSKGLQEQDWLRAQSLLDSGEVLEGEVTAFNQGGVVVPFGRIQGFVPNSHLTTISRGLRGGRLREAKSELVGQTLSLVVIEVNQPRRRLIFSERMAGKRLRQQLLKELEEGQVRTGIVSGLVDFGAFVDLGGVDGLIHVSELGHDYVEHPSEVLSAGDEVEVLVLGVDRERKRIALSRKRLLPDPWDSRVSELREGQTVRGTVTGVVDFGAFVDLGQGVEGLIHVSNLRYGYASLQELGTGTPVTVQVRSIDKVKRQISLQLQDIVTSFAQEVKRS